MSLSSSSSEALLKRKVIDCAFILFREKGFKNCSIIEIAAKAEIPLETFYKYFSSKNDILLSLYLQISNDLEEQIQDLPASTLAVRFHQLVNAKLKLVNPYRDILKSLIIFFIDEDHPAGITSRETTLIRLKGIAIFKSVVEGASDKPVDKEAINTLAKTLYGAHWAVLFLFLMDTSENASASRNSLDLAASALTLPLLSFGKPEADGFMKQVSSIADQFLHLETNPNTELAHNILNQIFLHRKISDHSDCGKHPCEECYSIHLYKLNYFINNNEPIHFILPAFPAKSPNQEKVLGKIPDLGEEIAITFLRDLADRIKLIYPPGAKITICADGRIFSDLVMVNDEDVSTYTANVKSLIDKTGSPDIELLNLEDIVKKNSFDEARNYVVDTYAETLDSLKERTKQFPHHMALFNGMHRFISEDRLVLFRDSKSKTQIKEESKEIAYRVIQRSNAWTKLIQACFPHAMRLSIHPQHAHSDKIGIRLTRAVDDWITPWHGVIVLRDNDYVLMKKQEAEALHATLVEKNGAPNHYVVN